MGEKILRVGGVRNGDPSLKTIVGETVRGIKESILGTLTTPDKCN